MGRTGEPGGSGFEFVKARLTGEKPDLGENRKVTVDLRDAVRDSDA